MYKNFYIQVQENNEPALLPKQDFNKNKRKIIIVGSIKEKIIMW